MLIRFASDYNKQANTVIKQGGMRGKYKTLINHILRQDSSARIIQETNTFISVGLTGISGSTIFFIHQTFGSSMSLLTKRK